MCIPQKDTARVVQDFVTVRVPRCTLHRRKQAEHFRGPMVEYSWSSSPWYWRFEESDVVSVLGAACSFDTGSNCFVCASFCLFILACLSLKHKRNNEEERLSSD